VKDDQGNGVLGYVEANSIPGTQDTVRTENSVSDNFGFSTTADLTWVHRIDWLGSIPSFSEVTLQIFTQSVDQQGLGGLPNDPVYLNLDSSFLGYLTSSSPTTFTLSGVQLGYLGDGFLEVRVDPRGFNNSDNNDTIAVNGSKLSITYDPDAAQGAQSVPDGGTTAVLLGGSLVAMCLVRRKFAAVQ
jgi:protein with PEP-CTERM/exosortase system signal